MSDYDTWLLNQADEYMTGCTPTVVNVHYEYEGRDEPPSQSFDYNCEGCDERDCEHWLEYNEGEPCITCSERTGGLCRDCSSPLCEVCKCPCESEDTSDQDEIMHEQQDYERENWDRYAEQQEDLLWSA